MFVKSEALSALMVSNSRKCQRLHFLMISLMVDGSLDPKHIGLDTKHTSEGHVAKQQQKVDYFLFKMYANHSGAIS